MPSRTICSATITFGLVSIPVKFFTSASAGRVSFNLLSPEAGNRVQQKLFDSVTGLEIPGGMDACDKGFEVAKGEYVKFKKDEIKALDAECDQKTIDIQEFVDATSIDPIAVEKTYYLGPDKGADKGYSLLSEAMSTMSRAAVAQWNSRGKEHLVVIRPYRGGLVLHQMFYSNEVRNFDEIEVAKLSVSEPERKMAGKLIASLSSGEFDPSKYEDSYSARVKQAIQDKLAGGTIRAVPSETPKMGSVFDLSALLERSLAAGPKPKAKKPPTPKK